MSEPSLSSRRRAILACGESHCLVRLQGSVAQFPETRSTPSTVYAWGLGASGQLGNGSFESRNRPQRLSPRWGEIVSVAAGPNHSFALNAAGRIWGWGRNFSGSLGDGTFATFDQELRASAYEVSAESDPKFVSVAAGQEHGLAMTADGRVYSWGTDTFGQRGDFYTRPLSVGEVAAGLGLWMAGIRFEGGAIRTIPPGAQEINSRREQRGSPTRNWTGLVGVGLITAGTNHSLALLEDGRVVAWGRNSEGQLGQPKNAWLLSEGWAGIGLPVPVEGLPRIVDIAAGHSFSAAVGVDGRVFVWGNDADPEMGVIRAEGPHVPVAVPGLTGVTRIAARGPNLLALKPNQGVYQIAWTFRWLPAGGLSLTYSAEPLPHSADLHAIAVGFDHFLGWVPKSALDPKKRDPNEPAPEDSGELGQVVAWGRNSFGELGDPAEPNFVRRLEPKPVPGLTHVGYGVMPMR